MPADNKNTVAVHFESSIDGMQFSATIPLAGVGFVMAAIFEQGGSNLQITPVAGLNGHNRVNKVVESMKAAPKRLPAPSRDDELYDHSPVQTFLRSWFPKQEEGRIFRYRDIAAATKAAGFSNSVGATLTALAKQGFVDKLSHGTYRMRTKKQLPPPGKSITGANVRGFRLPALLKILANGEEKTTAQVAELLRAKGFTIKGTQSVHSL